MSSKMSDFLIYIFIPLVVVLAGFYFGQRKLMYLPNPVASLPTDVNMPSFTVIKLKTSDNLTLSSWYQAAKDKPTLIYIHGNAGNVSNRAPFVKRYLTEGYGVLLLGYRGYGGNPGSPSEPGLYRDARAAIKFLQNEGIPDNKIVLFGESLGTGIAVQMALEFQVRALILQTPYTAMADIGQYHYPFLPVRMFLKDRYNSIAKISKINIPILILHGHQDRVVPIRFAKQLYAAANVPKTAKYYPDKGHNNIISPQLQQDVLDFLAQL